MNKTILIIGAGGFIGGFIAAEALRRGYDVWAGVRESTSRRYLDDPRLHFAVFDYDDPEAVRATLRDCAPAAGRWDYIIWNLGATKCARFSDFNLINFMYPRTFVELLRSEDMVPERFLYMSSLSAVGPADERGYTPITSATVPDPNTRYGLSKIKTETYLETLPDFPWTIFRPTGVYGPHEQDYLMMVKSIDSGWDFGVGYRRQLLTFIYVEDLVTAMFQALESPATLRRKYIISEDRAYTQAEFRRLVARLLGRKVVVPVRLPLWAVYAASAVAEEVGRARLKASTLNRDKYKIMKQRNWSCDISDARRDFGFAPRFTLEEGMRRTVEAYLESKAARKAAKGGRR
ncbi:MAG: NAD(P)-dependent oxidoreductase [Bacteroides sp.]|nr:NAD(P)-dependent oxidoreductase [Bacteroides sp.]MCM1095385.1 NAD(P)-dependent oxidoreductase [Terasakiella sp.]